MRISDWSSDVCSSDLLGRRRLSRAAGLSRGARAGARADPRGARKRTDAAGCARARGAAAMKAPGTGGGLTFSDLHRAVARDRYSDFLPLVAWVEEEAIGRAHVRTPVTNAPLVC